MLGPVWRIAQRSFNRSKGPNPKFLGWRFEKSCLCSPVVEKQFFSRLNSSFGKDAYPMIAVDHHNFGVAIRINGMIGEAYFVSFSRSIDNEIVVEIEEKAAHVFVVNFSTTIGLILANYFAAIFGYEFVFASRIFEENSPACYVRRRHQKMFVCKEIKKLTILRDNSKK